MGLDQAVTARLVAGIGFRHGVGSTEIVALIRQALAAAGAGEDRLSALATALDRAGDPALREAAAVFGLVPEGISRERLEACGDRIVSRSPRIEALRGVGCLCEAAALAAAGPDADLALARIATGSVTCALAFRDQTRHRADE